MYWCMQYHEHNTRSPKTLSHEYNVNKGANCWLKNMTGDYGERSSNIDDVVLRLDE